MNKKGDIKNKRVKIRRKITKSSLVFANSVNFPLLLEAGPPGRDTM